MGAPSCSGVSQQTASGRCAHKTPWINKEIDKKIKEGIKTVTGMRGTLLLAAICLFLASCETIQGAGRDITRAGEAIDDAITDD